MRREIVRPLGRLDELDGEQCAMHHCKNPPEMQIDIQDQHGNVHERFFKCRRHATIRQRNRADLWFERWGT